MTPRITEQEVRQIAKLARLELGDAEVALYTQQLAGVLENFSLIQGVDVEGVEPMTHPTDASNQQREDVPSTPLPLEVAMSNAPDRAGEYFKVPRVLGGAR